MNAIAMPAGRVSAPRNSARPPRNSPLSWAPVAVRLRINLWSGPRNVSTALMYSFAQRSDTRVVDEPLYAHYLAVSGGLHPGREEVLAAQEQDAQVVIRDVILGDGDRPVVFFK